MSETLSTSPESVDPSAQVEAPEVSAAENSEILEATPEAPQKQTALNRLANFFLNAAAKTESLDIKFQDFKAETSDNIDSAKEKASENIENAKEKAKEVSKKVGNAALVGVDVVIGLGVIGGNVVSSNYKKAEAQVTATAEKVTDKVTSAVETTKTFVTEKATEARDNATAKIDSVGNFFNDKVEAAKAYAKKLKNEALERKNARIEAREKQRASVEKAIKDRVEAAKAAKANLEKRGQEQKEAARAAYEKKIKQAKNVGGNVLTFLMRTRATGQAARQAASDTWKNYSVEK